MQNKQQTEDLRVRRTRKLLMQALIELTIEKGFSAITVQDIANRAMVNRATFYRHYVDKYDLLEQYMNEVYALTEPQEPAAMDGTNDPVASSPPVGLVSMFKQVQTHADFFGVMLGPQGDPAFAQRIQQYSERRLRHILPAGKTQTTPGDPPLELCLSYLSHAGIGAIKWWLTEGQSCSPEQIAQWLNQLNIATVELAMK